MAYIGLERRILVYVWRFSSPIGGEASEVRLVLVFWRSGGEEVVWIAGYFEIIFELSLHDPILR